MNPILSILRAAHCRSTHHYFAVDALPLVETSAGQRLTKVLLRHHDAYLTGAKDPDTRFRDFQNHVVHVTDGYWGGAPRVAHQWYDRLQKYLVNARWNDAAHAAGVLSHYFTDPIMPLHTQQSEQEKVLHRPIEWSVTKSYRSIMQLWNDDEMQIVFEMSRSPGWLGEAILHGARHANKFYHPLMDTYDLARGRRRPADGLSLIAKQALAELFGLAVTGWARVIERAAADAELAIERPLPEPSVIWGTLLAGTRVPMRLWIRKIDHTHQRQRVEALIAEFESTGKVSQNLPAEVDIVHRVIKVHGDELAWKRRREQLKSTETAIKVDKPADDIAAAPATTAATTAAQTTPVQSPPNPTVLPFPHRNQSTVDSSRLAPAVMGLRRDDPLVEAPSIGPRTAARFAAIGIHRVDQFLDADVRQVADDLSTRWISVALLSLWQTQACVMCEVPELNCLDAQMLAGCGLATSQAVADCDVQSLSDAVGRYAETSAGRRYLRGQQPPDIQRVGAWIEKAKSIHRFSEAVDPTGLPTRKAA